MHLYHQYCQHKIMGLVSGVIVTAIVITFQYLFSLPELR